MPDNANFHTVIFVAIEFFGVANKKKSATPALGAHSLRRPGIEAGAAMNHRRTLGLFARFKVFSLIFVWNFEYRSHYLPILQSDFKRPHLVSPAQTVRNSSHQTSVHAPLKFRFS